MTLPCLTDSPPLPAFTPSVPRRCAALAGIGTSLPAEKVSTAVIAARLGVEADWIIRRTGIRSRHVAGPKELLSDHAARAARQALERAGAATSDVDLVVVATTTPDKLLPNVAPIVANQLEARRAGAFDVGAACSGFISGLAVSAGQIEAGRIDCAVVIGADFMSRVTDPNDRATAAVFADGAGAAVVAASEGDGGIGPIVLGSDGAGAELIEIERGGVVSMNGPETFRAAVAHLSQASQEAAVRAGVALEEIDLFCYHQANGRILAAVGERLKLPRERVIDCIGEFGNTSASTLPLALAHAEEQDQLHAGDLVLMAAFGAGFTWGATVMRWGPV